MKYLNVRGLLIVLLLCAGQEILAQQYYINLSARFRTCNPSPCSGTALFNGQRFAIGPTLVFNGELTIPASEPPTTFSCTFGGTCGPPSCNTSGGGSGTMPSPYKGTATIPNGVGSFTYCWEPILANTQASLSGVACGEGNSVNLSLNTWGYSYQWQVSVNETNDWKNLGTISDPSGAPLQSASTVVSQDALRSLFGDLYGKNFFFRTVLTGCKVRTTEPSVAISFVAPKPVISLASPTDVICNGQSNGTVVMQIASSVIDRFFINCTNLDNGFTSQVPAVPVGNSTITGLGAGRWEFEVVNNNSVDRDKYGSCSAKIGHVVNEPTKVAVTFNVPLYNTFAIKCNGGNQGEATAVGTGGVGGYNDFHWNTTATSAAITGLTAATYSVSLKDANGCPASGSVELKQPTTVQVSLSPSTGYNGYAVSCWDKNDGGVNSTVVGGITSQPYTYGWSTGATGSSISGKGIGTYSVTVTDANGCPDSENITLAAPLPINFTIDQTGTLSCPGDATISLDGRSIVNTIGTVSYAWSSGEMTSSVTGKGPGTYTLTVSDQQGCSTPESVTVDPPRAHTVSIAPLSNYNGSEIKCNGGSDGELEAIVKDSNGVVVAAQNYLWTQNGTRIGESPTLVSVDDLNEGVYKVVITYGTGCETDDTYVLSDPDPVLANAVATTDYNGQPIKCFNGSDANIRATAGGGTPGAYSYSWNTGATTALVTGVGAGTYVVTVKDVNECVGNATVRLDNPTPVEASILSVSDYSGYSVSCNGSSNGSITAEGLGGTGVYTYSWSDGKTTAFATGLVAGSYTLTVSDNNGCQDSFEQVITTPAILNFFVAGIKDISCFSGSDGQIELQSSGGAGNYQYSRNNGASWQPENVFSALPQGPYTITLRDGNGCTKTAASTLTQPTQINISFADIQPAFCNDPSGTARAIVTGGVSGYTYRWEDSGATVVDIDEVLSGVKGGIYTLIVHDENACERRSNVPITSTDGARSTYAVTAARCFDSSDGSAEITITAGEGPFVIEWPDGQSTLQGVNLKKDQYNVLITDRNNCTVIQAVDVPAPDAIDLTVQNSVVPTCNGFCDGQLTLQATGGVGGYVYEWNGKAGAAQTQLCAVVYPVIVTDANNCILHQDVALAQPEPLDISVAQSVLATCEGDCDGSLEALATGGNGGYQYAWAVGGNTNIKTGICPGTYSVSVRDMKGCQGEASLVLNNTPALPLDLGGGITLCVGQSHTLDAGPTWAGIKWGSSTGFESTAQRVTINDVGSYWLEVLSDKGCVGQDTFLLETSYDLLQASFMIPQEAVAGDTVVMIDISWPLPETVEWNYPVAMREVLNLGDVLFGQFDEAGTYEVAMTARLGECVDQISKTIVILEGEEGSEDGRLGYEKFVMEFTVYPNPTDGAFDVGIELLEKSHVTLSVWKSPTGVLIKQVQHDNQKLYRVSFDLRPLTAGTYILKLDHAKGKEYIRFVVY